MKNFEELFIKNKEKCKQLGVYLNPPAKAEEIHALSTLFNFNLPKELEDFYNLCNGFETEDFLFRVLPINEILEYKHELEADSFYFAEYMIYSDTWIIKVKDSEEYYLLNGDHNTCIQLILTNSIYEFIERYLSGGGIFGNQGLYKWLEDVKEKKTN